MPVSSLLLNQNSDAVRRWAWLAVLSLAFSGLAPLVLIAGRASIYADLALVKEWFKPVLVVHVNLSVGLWFLAMGMVLQYALRPAVTTLRSCQTASAICFLLAILLMAFAPLAGGEAFTSNYIPVQDNPLFFMGLSLVLVSLLLGVLPFLMTSAAQNELAEYTLLTLPLTLAAFVFSTLQHPAGYGGEGFYEAIFWGGGHLLQLFYVQLGALAWYALAEKLDIRQPPRWLMHSVFGLLWLNAMLAMGVYWFFDVNEYYHIKLFTWQMNCATGTLPAVLALWYAWHGCKAKWRAQPVAAGFLSMSLLLFLGGGAIAYLIEGSSVTIPAHYHGSTVGVTLALMGVFWLVLPWQNTKVAIAQPLLYGVGQLLHVGGLAVAGGHNIARKTAGSLDVADQAAASALQVMRLGGLLAVLGGGVFVVLALRALLRKPSERIIHGAN